MSGAIPEKEGYKIKKHTFNLFWANLFSLILMVIFGILFIVPYLLVWQNLNFKGQWIWIVFLLIGLALHELIHGITFAILNKDYKFKHIHFGIKWKYLTPYCHCDLPMKISDYIIGGLMPLLLLGIFPALVGICFHHFEWVVFGIFFSASSAGDILIVWQTRKMPKESLILDNPNEIGFLVYEKMV